MRRAAAASAIAVMLVAAGCGTRVPLSEIAGPNSVGTTTTTGVASGESTTTTLGHSSAAGTQSGAGTTTTSAGSSNGGGSQALTPTTPGTYTYNQSGPGTTLQIGSGQPSTTAPPPQGTTVYDSSSSLSQGFQQVAHQYLNTQQPPTDTTFVESQGGIYIAQQIQRMTVGSSTVTFTCTFSPPMEISPWPLRTGYSFTGSASCNGGSSGSFMVSASGKITGTQTVTLDGAPVTAYVVNTSITTSGSVTSSGTEVDWYAPSLRLDVHSSLDQHGNFGSVATFTTSVTRDLVSGHPH